MKLLEWYAGLAVNCFKVLFAIPIAIWKAVFGPK